MAKYSEFINFPIYLYSSKEVHTSTQAQTLTLAQIMPRLLGSRAFQRCSGYLYNSPFPLRLCWLQILLIG